MSKPTSVSVTSRATQSPTDDDLGRWAREVITIEQQAVTALTERIDGEFTAACRMILQSPGRLIVTGMGKSGHIGRKLAATLASTGTPSFFVHPGEASHGDLGMITPDDIVLAISNSGESDELNAIMPVFKRRGIAMIAMTGNPRSTLARHAEQHLSIFVEREACPHNLAPTASTTATLVLGDALAVALLKARGFTPEEFALSHPGGALGRSLLLLIDDLLHSGDDAPRVHQNDSVSTCLLEVSRKRLGMAAVLNDDGEVIGVFTDGDLRRLLAKRIDLDQPVIRVMTPDPVTVQPGMLAAEALHLMQERRINGLLVCDDSRQLVGALNMHDLLRAGVV